MNNSIIGFILGFILCGIFGLFNGIVILLIIYTIKELFFNK